MQPLEPGILRQQLEHHCDRIAAADRRAGFRDVRQEPLQVPLPDAIKRAEVHLLHLVADIPLKRGVVEIPPVVREVRTHHQQRFIVHQPAQRIGRPGERLIIHVADDERDDLEILQRILQHRILDLRAVLFGMGRVAAGDLHVLRQGLNGLVIDRDRSVGRGDGIGLRRDQPVLQIGAVSRRQHHHPLERRSQYPFDPIGRRLRRIGVSRMGQHENVRHLPFGTVGDFAQIRRNGIIELPGRPGIPGSGDGAVQNAPFRRIDELILFHDSHSLYNSGAYPTRSSHPMQGASPRNYPEIPRK